MVVCSVSCRQATDTPGRTPKSYFGGGSRVPAGDCKDLGHRGGGDLQCPRFSRTAYRMASGKADYVAPTEQGFVPLFSRTHETVRRRVDDLVCSEGGLLGVGWVREDAVSALCSGVNRSSSWSDGYCQG